MGLLDFFKRSTSVAPVAGASKEAYNSETQKAETTSDPANSVETGSGVIGYETGMPIDLIYYYLKEDNEKKGYDDALCNPDNSYKEMNKSLIRSNLEVKFKQVVLKYTDDLRAIDFHIESRSQAGLVDVVEQLKSKKETLQKHMSILVEMEDDLRKDAPYMLGMLMSYERGFLKGLAAISLETFRSKQS